MNWLKEEKILRKSEKEAHIEKRRLENGNWRRKQKDRLREKRKSWGEIQKIGDRLKHVDRKTKTEKDLNDWSD